MGDALGSIAAGKPPELAAAARKIVEIIDGSPYELDASVRWGALTYALMGDIHHWICSVSVTRKRANLTFHFGGILDDPEARFVAGSSKLLRKVEYEADAEVDASEVLGFLDQAVGRYPWFKEHWRELT